MARWEPGARGRLEQAAFELFVERGFDRTTASDIAVRAGLAERTFFRHFADKREVLFGGAGQLQELLVREVGLAPDGAAPLDAVALAVQAAGAVFHREQSRQRQRLIAGSAELRERELIKLATLAAAVGEALQQRGVDASAATLAAEAGIAVFTVAVARWVDGERAFAEVVSQTLAELRVVVGPPPARPRGAPSPTALSV